MLVCTGMYYASICIHLKYVRTSVDIYTYCMYVSKYVCIYVHMY